MKKIGNKGFSLVELIIVIAIMAILVGIMAPQLLKYIEKSQVEADRETLDAVYKGIVYAMADPDINEDDDSKTIINSLSSPVKLESLMNPAGNLFAQEICDTCGWPDLTQKTYESYLKSTHKSNCEIYVMYDGHFKNPLVMWITTTDASGGRDTSHAPTTCTNPETDLEGCIAIY